MIYGLLIQKTLFQRQTDNTVAIHFFLRYDNFAAIGGMLNPTQVLTIHLRDNSKDLTRQLLPIHLRENNKDLTRHRC
jgi:hypothetical protein